MAEPDDPEQLALLWVQQWLSERGYLDVLQSLEKVAGIKFDSDKCPTGSRLLTLVYAHMEAQAATEPDDVGLARQTEEEALMRGGLGDFGISCSSTLEAISSANLVALQLWPGQAQVLLGAGDGSVALVTFSGQVVWRVYVGGGGVLCLDLHPSFRLGDERITVGSMDGSLSILNAASGALIGTHKVHSKYVMRTLWAGDGQRIATCSFDQSVAIHRVQGGVGADGTSNSSDVPSAASIDTVHTVPYASAVNDICFLKDGSTLVVALRGSCQLRVLDLSRPDQQPSEQSFNMNESVTDMHVSFSALQLRTSPCGLYLLVSTDGPRILLLRTHDYSRLRVLYGLPTENFHQPATAWHRDSQYIYAAVAAGRVFVYHVGSGKQVAQLASPHKANVRDMCYDVERNLLATCSFDKAVKLYVAEQVL